MIADEMLEAGAVVAEVLEVWPELETLLVELDDDELSRAVVTAGNAIAHTAERLAVVLSADREGAG